RAGHGARREVRHRSARGGPRRRHHRRSRSRHGARQGRLSMPSLDHRGRVRVAITGLGVKTPAGSEVDSFWNALTAGISAAAPLTIIDTDDLAVKFGC